jgi:hypothetical protein
MPFSTSYFKQQTKEYILDKYGRAAKILDIGAGAGAYYDMLSIEGYNNLDCVEAFESYIVNYKLREKYKKVLLGDVTKLDIDFDQYDLIILGDVLEHIQLEEAKILLNKMKRSNVIIGVPFESPQGIHFDNTFEIHLQEDLTFINFFERFEGYKPFCLRFDYGLFVKESIDTIFLETQQYIIPKQYQDYIDLNFKEYYLKNIDIVEVNIDNSTPQKGELTVVTGLWSIGRPGRNFDHYIQHFNNVLDIDINLFIYVPKEYEYLVWAKRKKHNTYVKVFELDDLKNNIYKPHWDKTQEIRNNPKWFNQTGEGGWLANSPQASLEWYNPIVQSKMFLLHSASIWNPFTSKYFMWLDAGITNTVYEKYFTENRVLDKIVPHLESFLFLSYPYEASDEIHGFDFNAMNRYAGKKVEYVCRGGLFGGTKEIIDQANALYYSLLQKSLSEGYMGTEESIFTIMSYLEPEKYRRYALDSNGLIVKFIQTLIADNVELEPIPYNRVYLKPKSLDTSNLKTSLYILTFNFPEQVEHTIKTWKANSSDWLVKSHRRVLIDNSNNFNAIEVNKSLCEKYGFEHIITGENLGINRGRQLVAEHFDNSDSDYYFFFEDDMGFNLSTDNGFCRNGFRKYIPNLYDTVHKIMLKEEFDFLKLSYTEVYMDNNIQVSWYNVPQETRTRDWPDYDRLPETGLDLNAPRTELKNIEVVDELSYLTGDIYYCNWPMIVSKKGNQKMFLDTTWARPYEQTWMSYMYQETKKGNLRPAVLLASPIHHNRIAHYSPEERREN